MTKTEKRKLENYDITLELLKDRIKINKEICNDFMGVDSEIKIKRHIIAYAKLVTYRRILHELTRGIKEHC